MFLFGPEIWGRQDSLGFEISGSQAVQDYLIFLFPQILFSLSENFGWTVDHERPQIIF